MNNASTVKETSLSSQAAACLLSAATAEGGFIQHNLILGMLHLFQSRFSFVITNRATEPDACEEERNLLLVMQSFGTAAKN